MFLFPAGCNGTERNMEFISISFPMGESDLRVWRNGKAILFYGALPQGEIIKTGTFDVERLYEQVKPLLHSNIPREDWPNPKAKAGMVQVRFESNTQTTSYLIFDADDFTKELFEQARRNVVGKFLDEKPSNKANAADADKPNP
jgi:hypothetical protein